MRKFLGIHDEELLSSDYWGQVFTSMDTNHDNMVSFEEFVVHLWPPPVADRIVAGSVVVSASSVGADDDAWLFGGADDDAVITTAVIAPNGISL